MQIYLSDPMWWLIPSTWQTEVGGKWPEIHVVLAVCVLWCHPVTTAGRSSVNLSVFCP